MKKEISLEKEFKKVGNKSNPSYALTVDKDLIKMSGIDVDKKVKVNIKQ